MSRDWDLIYHKMTPLYLTLFKEVLCFGYKRLQNVRIQQHYLLISGRFLSNLSISQAKKNKQRGKVSRRGSYQTIND